MKKVSDALNSYMNNEKHFEIYDMYSLHLKSGNSYYIAAADKDIDWDGIKWKSNLFIISREQIKLQGAPTVDTLSVSIKCDSEDVVDGVPFMQACHNGNLDNAVLTLYKAYFKDGLCVGAYKIFEGLTEVSTAGGLGVKLVVKSIVQGLSQEIPIRIFAPQSAYAANKAGSVVSSDQDTYTMLIPLKPSMRVLLQV